MFVCFPNITTNYCYKQGVDFQANAHQIFTVQNSCRLVSGRFRRHWFRIRCPFCSAYFGHFGKNEHILSLFDFSAIFCLFFVRVFQHNSMFREVQDLFSRFFFHKNRSNVFAISSNVFASATSPEVNLKR